MVGAVTVGTRVRINGTFSDASNTLFDPASLQLVLASSVSSRGRASHRTYTYGVDAELKRSSTGKYYIDVLMTDVGTWRYRWQSSALNEESVLEGQIQVQAMGF